MKKQHPSLYFALFVVIIIAVVYFSSSPVSTEIIPAPSPTAEEIIQSKKAAIIAKLSDPQPLTQIEKDAIFSDVGGQKGQVYTFTPVERELLLKKLNQ